MKHHHTSVGLCSILWAIFTLSSLGISIFLGLQGHNNIYDIDTGLKFLTDQPLLVIGSAILRGLSGVVLVFMIVGFFHYVRDADQSIYDTAATAIGLMSATLFVISGTVGGHALFDLLYVRQQGAIVQSANAYLPLVLLINRTMAAASTMFGLWFLLVNLRLRSRGTIPIILVISGLLIGGLMLLGLILPGGGFSLFGLLLAALWAIVVGVFMLKNNAIMTSTE